MHVVILQEYKFEILTKISITLFILKKRLLKFHLICLIYKFMHKYLRYNSIFLYMQNSFEKLTSENVAKYIWWTTVKAFFVYISLSYFPLLFGSWILVTVIIFKLGEGSKVSSGGNVLHPTITLFYVYISEKESCNSKLTHHPCGPISNKVDSKTPKFMKSPIYFQAFALHTI